MKKVILLFFVFVLSLSAYGQDSTLNDGDKCFKQGDYVCAETKYKEVLKFAVGKENQIAEIKTQRAKRCIEYLKTADVAFSNKNYKIAKEDYLSVLDSNPEDSYVIAQLEKIKTFTIKPATEALTLSKTEINFASAGGTASISVATNLNDYSFKLLPSWCTITKYDNNFVIKCNPNSSRNSRTDYFHIVAGNKLVRVNITQQGEEEIGKYYLNISSSNLYFSIDGGNSENIVVRTDASDYSITLVPSWCEIKKYSGYITIKCSPNYNNQYRSDWFKIVAGKTEVRVDIRQEGGNKKVTQSNTRIKKPKLNSFSSLGFQSGEIATYGLLYERGGRRAIGFRMSARTSLIDEEDLLNGTVTQNKTEIELGPNIKISNRFYLNIGGGYGYYDKIINNDYNGSINLEKTTYYVATTGLMIRMSRVININGGVSFIDIDKDIYKPEITFGISFNLRGKYKS